MVRSNDQHHSKDSLPFRHHHGSAPLPTTTTTTSTPLGEGSTYQYNTSTPPLSIDHHTDVDNSLTILHSSPPASGLDRLFRLSPTRAATNTTLLQGASLLVLSTLCLGVGILIGTNQQAPNPSTTLTNTHTHAPVPFLGNAYTPQDVDTLFTAYHFTDCHIEPLYDKDQVVKGTCRNRDCCKKGKSLCEAFTYSPLDPPTLGCDPPISLLNGTLEAMLAIDPSVAYLLFTGDMNAHHLCDESLIRVTQVCSFLSACTCVCALFVLFL